MFRKAQIDIAPYKGSRSLGECRRKKIVPAEGVGGSRTELGSHCRKRGWSPERRSPAQSRCCSENFGPPIQTLGHAHAK